MKSLRPGVVVCAIAVLLGVFNTACSRHYVIVPQPQDGYAPTDTLYGRLNGDEIRVTFWFDTVLRVDTVVRLDTLWEKGSRTLVRWDTVTVTDTVVRVDTVRVRARTMLDTVLRVDTLRIATTDTLVRVDTVRLTLTDTVRLTVTDTVRITVTDTIRVAGQRMLFVPPGHYPPEGQCRVWIHDRPPGQQAPAAPCTGLGDIPAGAFILFGGEAWDFDYDWLGHAESDPGSVPPEIIALQRRGEGRPPRR